MSSRLRAELAPSRPLASALMASVQVAELTSEGSLPLPPNTTHALVEIGCSDVQTMDEERLDRPADATAFLLSFEPLLDKYAVLLHRGTTRYHGGKGDMAVPLAHHHRRGVVLPLGVSAHGTAPPRTFNATHAPRTPSRHTRSPPGAFRLTARRSSRAAHGEIGGPTTFSVWHAATERCIVTTPAVN